MSFFDKILPTIASVAPTIASALGGPLAGMGVAALASALGLDPAAANTPVGQDAITKAVLGMTPEIAANVRKADQEFALKMRALDIDVEKLAQEDRSSARSMQTATRALTPSILAFAVTSGFFALLATMAFVPVPTANQSALNIMIGALGAAFGGIIGFYFGSSAGSQAKDNIIKELKT